MSGKTTGAAIINELFAVIESRKGGDPETSYTAKLFDRGRELIARKFGEEAVETVLAAVKDDRGEIAAESADVLFHLMVLWADAGLTPDDIWAQLEARRGTSGIEEKKSRKPA
ncbi:MAG: phosphoribosyl-ATP diphosphatase [Rhodospirillales bacterium]